MVAHIHSICKYHPTRIYGEKNPAFANSRESKLLLDFKSPTNPNHKTAVTYFTGKLNSFLAKSGFNLANTIAAVTPSSTAGQYSQGLIALIQNLQHIYKYEPQISLLIRAKNIIPLHSGGNRGISTHFDSVIVNPQIQINGRRILLLDDIVTTGGTLQACTSILETTGASEVIAIALGKTTYE